MVSFLSPASQFTNKYQVSNLSTRRPRRKLLFSSPYHPSIYPSLSASNLVRVLRLSFEITCLRESSNIFTCRCFVVSCWPLRLRSILAGRIWLVFFCAPSHSRPYLQFCFPFRSYLWVHHFLVHVRLCITPGSWVSMVRKILYRFCMEFMQRTISKSRPHVCENSWNDLIQLWIHSTLVLATSQNVHASEVHHFRERHSWFSCIARKKSLRLLRYSCAPP